MVAPACKHAAAYIHTGRSLTAAAAPRLQPSGTYTTQTTLQKPPQPTFQGPQLLWYQQTASKTQHAPQHSRWPAAPAQVKDAIHATKQVCMLQCTDCSPCRVPPYDAVSAALLHHTHSLFSACTQPTLTHTSYRSTMQVRHMQSTYKTAHHTASPTHHRYNIQSAANDTWQPHATMHGMLQTTRAVHKHASSSQVTALQLLSQQQLS